MAVSQRLELRQSQSLVMTPQLQQAIKLLQLSNLELTEFVQQELEQNPLLDRDDGTGNEALSSTGDNDLGQTEESGSGDRDTGDTQSLPDSMELHSADTLPDSNSAPLDTDYDSYYDSSPDNQWSQSDTAFSNWGPGGNTRFDDATQSLEESLGSTVTLREHIQNQIHLDIHSPTERLIAFYLTDQLDEAGYMKTDLNEVAEQLGCGINKVEEVLHMMQACDPIGVFARDLAECLALQLAEKNRLDPAIQALLDNLDLLAKRDFPGLKKVCGVDEEDLVEMIAEIRALNPRPSAIFEREDVEAIIPDVMVRADRKDGWLVELNNDALPKVLVNTQYYEEVSQRTRNKEEKSYLAEQYQSANWLVKALHQRATTVLKVASEIVRQQDGFLRRGVQGMKPLTLKDIAEAIEMHESTVSRVTSNKYMVTPRGTYELKYFFTSAIGGADGGNHSAEAVRERIRQLIDREDPKKILSDDALVAKLKSEGIDIARRTVAKYREAMNIPSSVQRRREKAVLL